MSTIVFVDQGEVGPESGRRESGTGTPALLQCADKLSLRPFRWHIVGFWDS